MAFLAPSLYFIMTNANSLHDDDFQTVAQTVLGRDLTAQELHEVRDCYDPQPNDHWTEAVEMAIDSCVSRSSKHAPPPWKNYEWKDSDGFVHCGIDTDYPYPGGYIDENIRNRSIATMTGVRMHEYDEENRANARLIAAAPELLEAAQDVIKAIPPSKLKGTIRENFSEQVALSQLSRAIAKARGR